MPECSVEFPGPVSRTTLCRLVIDYIKYILYYRGQFPLPLDQLKLSLGKDKDASHTSRTVNHHQIYSDSSDNEITHQVPRISTRENRSKQVFRDTVTKFDKFFNKLSSILEDENVLEIVLNLGANMMSPKELYRITLPNRCFDAECKQDYASLQRCRMQFFKEILHSALWNDLSPDSLLPISVLLHLGPGVSLSDLMEQKRFYALPKSCKQRTVHFLTSCTHAGATEIEKEIETSVLAGSCNPLRTDDAGLWVKMKSELRGFKCFMGKRSMSCGSLL